MDKANPDLAKQWHPTKNGTLTPADVTLHSGKKVWWMYDKGHEWQTTVLAGVWGMDADNVEGTNQSLQMGAIRVFRIDDGANLALMVFNQCCKN